MSPNNKKRLYQSVFVFQCGIVAAELFAIVALRSKIQGHTMAHETSNMLVGLCSAMGLF